jgi:hypothetical protein
LPGAPFGEGGNGGGILRIEERAQSGAGRMLVRFRRSFLCGYLVMWRLVRIGDGSASPNESQYEIKSDKTDRCLAQGRRFKTPRRNAGHEFESVAT